MTRSISEALAGAATMERAVGADSSTLGGGGGLGALVTASLATGATGLEGATAVRGRDGTTSARRWATFEAFKGGRSLDANGCGATKEMAIRDAATAWTPARCARAIHTPTTAWIASATPRATTVRRRICTAGP
jgi:hypothetical protein